MKFDVIYKFLHSDIRIRRHGMRLSQFYFNGKYLVVCKRVLHHLDKWTETPAQLTGYDIMADDWEVVENETT